MARKRNPEDDARTNALNGVVNAALAWRQAEVAQVRAIAGALERGTLSREHTFLTALSDKVVTCRRDLMDAIALHESVNKPRTR